MACPSFVETPAAQRRLIFLQLRIDVCRVVELPDGDARTGERRAVRGIVCVDRNLADDGTGPRIDVDHHRRAIRLMGDLDTRRDGRLHVPALSVDGLQRAGDVLCARCDGSVAEPLHHNPPQRVFGNAERAAELEPVDHVHGQEKVAQPHTTGRLDLRRPARPRSGSG